MNFHLFSVLVSVLLFPIVASANADLKPLRQALTAFQKSTVVSLPVEKKTISTLLEKTEISEGRIHLKKDRFRWETEKPVGSLILFDGKTLWTMQETPANLGGGTQITKASLNKAVKDQLLFRLLSGRVKIAEEFEVLKLEKTKTDLIFDLKPKKDDPTVRDFRLTVEAKGSRLKQIEFKDELGNVSTLSFGVSERVKKPAKDLFLMSVPKGAEVIEL